MAEPQWANAALQQLWAEGIDVRHLFMSTSGPDICPSFTREHFKYVAPARFSSGAQLVAIYEDRNRLAAGLECLWGGALCSINKSNPLKSLNHFDSLAHWRLNLFIGRSAWSFSPKSFVECWEKHRSLVQRTPAEQQVLQWYEANEPWQSRWHPYREGSGAMRRAPIWGAIYAGFPQQAAVAAAQDASASYGGWGVWSATVIAYAVAELWTYHDDPALTLVKAMTYVEPREHLGVKALMKTIHTTYADPWRKWVQLVNTEFSGYPKDHSLPNLLLIIGALH